MIKNLRMVYRWLLLFILLSLSVFCLLGCEYENIEITINEEEHIIWTDVDNAEYYTVTIEFPDGEIKKYTTETNDLDVFELFDKVGTYKISLSVEGDSKTIRKIRLPDPFIYEIEDKSTCFVYSPTKINGVYGYEALPTDECNISGKLIFPSSYRGLPVISLTDKDYEQNDYLGNPGAVIKYNLDKVTSLFFPNTFIEIRAFDIKKYPNIIRIKLSENIKELGSFNGGNSLKELIIPELVNTISKNTINNCYSLKKVYIGKNVTQIEGENFNSCEQLEEIVINSENKKYITENNYIIEKGKTNKIVSGKPGKQIPSSVGEIVDYSFSNVSIDIPELIIPSNIKNIGKKAFLNCKD